MLNLTHPCDLDSGNPCRNDGVRTRICAKPCRLRRCG
jgi:hypothetical protein